MSEIDWEKQALHIAETEHESSSWCEERAKRILQLGREMADARAEEIAKEINGILTATRHEDAYCAKMKAVNIARSFISRHKTREQVLEEALKEILAGDSARATERGVYIGPFEAIARRALEWRP